jgi:hypothetical protein
VSVTDIHGDPGGLGLLGGRLRSAAGDSVAPTIGTAEPAVCALVGGVLAHGPGHLLGVLDQC